MAKKPPGLRRSDTVGIVTLGSPFEAATIDAGIETLRGLSECLIPAFGRNVRLPSSRNK